MLEEQKRQLAKEQSVLAVFSHPWSLRTCRLKAYNAAREIQQQKSNNIDKKLPQAKHPQQRRCRRPKKHCP